MGLGRGTAEGKRSSGLDLEIRFAKDPAALITEQIWKPAMVYHQQAFT
jgi:hypothetical protein